MKCYPYILKSENREAYYTGISSHHVRRLRFHNNSYSKKHTPRNRPRQLAFIHEFTTREQAFASEKKVKSWKTKMI